jgi:type II secretory pathway component PulF
MCDKKRYLCVYFDTQGKKQSKVIESNAKSNVEYNLKKEGCTVKSVTELKKHLADSEDDE